ncbi:MAG: hypothetical protein FJX69_02635 [Alphaproteobacteria bacterium]|nr:hypothetical protein [Alphaproteobacteria bacterium]MBM3626631.1 hypothetical protein [Alphaproteobacteria bacterium]
MPARSIHRFGASDRLYRGARAASLADLAAGEVALFGLARDEAAARAIRDASWFAADRGPAVALADLGDAVAPAAAISAAISPRHALACLMGGDGDDAAAVALNAAPDATILLSARLDACPRLPAGRLLAIGTHDLLPAASMRAWLAAGGAVVAATGPGTLAARVRTALDAVAAARSVAVILDLGAVDAGHAAASGIANVGGMGALDVVETMAAIASSLRVVAMAVTGLEPERDPRGHGEILAAEAIAIAAASLRAQGTT